MVSMNPLSFSPAQNTCQPSKPIPEKPADRRTGRTADDAKHQIPVGFRPQKQPGRTPQRLEQMSHACLIVIFLQIQA
jgi:hypothetical protein